VSDPARGAPLAVLRRVQQSRPASPPGERCDLCAEPIPDEHGHLVDVQARNLLCACRGCHLLFTAPGAGGRRYRAVPDRYLSLPGSRLTAAQWEAFQIPVGIAFFFYNSALGRVAAFYPGPAGATESELALDAWEEVVAAHPVLESLEPDVEALLVRSARDRGEADGAECFVVPIDACYELAGRLRQEWRGFDGGREAHQEMDAFFERVRSKAAVHPS
jgi:Family of unknown function (DUF5947)